MITATIVRRSASHAVLDALRPLLSESGCSANAFAAPTCGAPNTRYL
ncbi:hypothetical protein ALQ60_200195 [Pseudomonas syringae pv. papulans]|nr:hypothetical protein ALQ60_200195 [Pseudomonas syringae pv. papulans]